MDAVTAPWAETMSSPEDPTGPTAEQRAAGREPLEEPVVLEVDAQRLDARSENASEAGVLVVAEEAIRVRVRVGDGELRPARLVRVQTLGGGRIGFAIEYGA